MADALIENPILNSPFLEPDRHFKFTDEDRWDAQSQIRAGVSATREAIR
jgi:hypothetical protein